MKCELVSNWVLNVIGAVAACGLIARTEAVAPSCSAFSLRPLAAQVLQHFHDYLVIDDA